MWDKLKTIIDKKGDKAVIIENGQPLYIVMSVDTYLDLKQKTEPSDTSAVKNNSPPPSLNKNTTTTQPSSSNQEIKIDEAHRKYADEFTNLEEFPY